MHLYIYRLYIATEIGVLFKNTTNFLMCKTFLTRKNTKSTFWEN